ncbi:MAG: FAD-dependent oxidoreductase [Chitinophagaceae bacterium]|nr:FAD-dependent oxidoreductase [Chitinophagaceae bacterium]
MSFWIDSVRPPEFPALKKDINTDVLIIGGGLAGLTTAYCLLKAGKKVVLVEDGLIGSGETGRTTAHLTAALDDRYTDIEKVFGEEGSRIAAESHTAAIDFIENVVKNENADCDFKRVDGFLFLHPSDKEENLRKEFDATRRAGLDTEWLDTTHYVSATNSPCIRFPRQAQFHIMKYLTALANAIAKMGGEIYTSTHAEKITIKGSVCNGFNVLANDVVVATNSPVNDMVTMHTKQMPFRTYVIGARLPKGKLPYALWWDSGNMNTKWFTAPYHYVRLQEFDDEYDLLIAGGEDHKTGQADDEGINEEDRYDALEMWTRKHFPQITDVVYQWSGQVLEPLDYMGFIGKNPGDDHVYIVTGDSGNGMTHTTIAGMLISDLIQGKDNTWAELYSPKRIPVKLPGRFLSEAFNMAKQYGDYIKKGDVEEGNQLANDEGGILSKGLRKIALYRDKSGTLHAYSAVCPHLGCVLQWNADEKTFDCPCHGSRFSKEGAVLNGPAISGLEKITVS